MLGFEQTSRMPGLAEQSEATGPERLDEFESQPLHSESELSDNERRLSGAVSSEVERSETSNSER